jgi:hypothetical protein
MSEHTYELKNPFEYALKGDTQTASFITMTAPGYKQVVNFTPIKQAFMSAISEVTEDLDGKQPEEAREAEGSVTGPQVMQLMYRWSGDMNKIFIHAAELFKSGVALIDGETVMKTATLDKMTMTDVEGLLGDYIANFIAPSLMDGQ